jgi:putative peptide zinc metalloprotease protein
VASSPGAATEKLSVPDRPKLAPGARLAGQMQESAFENPPWLIEREGAGYVQVTELLYRIAEQADGTHTLAEIAEIVSEKTGRSVSAENVRTLVGTQLLLKGLVAAADGRVVGAGNGARSLLALSGSSRKSMPLSA